MVVVVGMAHITWYGENLVRGRGLNGRGVYNLVESWWWWGGVCIVSLFNFAVVRVVVWESKDDRVREGEERVRLWGGQVADLTQGKSAGYVGWGDKVFLDYLDAGGVVR